MKTFKEFVVELDEIRMKPQKIADRKLAAWKVTHGVNSHTFKPEEEDAAKAKFDDVSKSSKDAQMYAIDQAGVTIPKNTLKSLKKKS